MLKNEEISGSWGRAQNISPKLPPRPSPEPPGSVPGGPRRLQKAPRAAQDAARAAQQPPRRPQEATRSDSSGGLGQPSGANCRPRGAQTPPGGHLGVSGIDFRLSGERNFTPRGTLLDLSASIFHAPGKLSSHTSLLTFCSKLAPAPGANLGPTSRSGRQ